MKNALTIFLCWVVTISFGQKKVDSDINFPFQVIYAENVVNGKGQKVKELDLVSKDDVLVVGADGFLSMVHFFGFPVEIAKDSIVTIKDLDLIIDDSKGRKKRKKYFYRARLDIDYLFVSDPRLARKGRLSSTGACHDCNPRLEVIYPPKISSIDIFYETDLCLVWQNTGASTYEIEIRNVFHDLLKTFTSSTNSLTIDASVLDNLRKDETLLLLRTRDMATGESSDLSAVRKFPQQNLDFPFTCSLTKATYALVTGLHLELLRGDYIREAEKYFTLAAELSDKAFYKNMLENFQKRKAK